MFEMGIDILRAVVTGAIFLYLRSLQGKEQLRFRKAWVFLLIGFGLISFGALLDLSDNFSYFDKYIVIGKTKYADFLEEVVGYLSGFVFVGIGFWKWIPAIRALREKEMAMKKSQEELQLKIQELTSELTMMREKCDQQKG
jgi:hypothetical protein